MAMRLGSRILFRIFSKLADMSKPDIPPENLAEGDFSSHIQLLDRANVYGYIQ